MAMKGISNFGYQWRDWYSFQWHTRNLLMVQCCKHIRWWDGLAMASCAWQWLLGAEQWSYLDSNGYQFGDRLVLNVTCKVADRKPCNSECNLVIFSYNHQLLFILKEIKSSSGAASRKTELWLWLCPILATYIYVPFFLQAELLQKI